MFKWKTKIITIYMVYVLSIDKGCINRRFYCTRVQTNEKYITKTCIVAMYDLEKAKLLKNIVENTTYATYVQIDEIEPYAYDFNTKLQLNNVALLFTKDFTIQGSKIIDYQGDLLDMNPPINETKIRYLDSLYMS